MKSVIVIIGLLIGLNLQAQSDTSIYHYRISLKGITNRCGSTLVQEPLAELFKTAPQFLECIETFVFESTQDVEQLDINKALSGYTITYFRKERIK